MSSSPCCWSAKRAAAWPKPTRAIDRYAIGKRIERIDQRIGELYREIAAAEARTIVDVAVKLRRLQVIDPRSRCGQELVDSALLAVEGMATG